MEYSAPYRVTMAAPEGGSTILMYVAFLFWEEMVKKVKGVSEWGGPLRAVEGRWPVLVALPLRRPPPPW
jgi:hypothetical protein